MEALAQPLKSKEGVAWETAGTHLAVRLLIVSRKAVTLETTHQQVDTGATVLADTRGTAAQAWIHFTILSCSRRKEYLSTNIHILYLPSPYFSKLVNIQSYSKPNWISSHKCIRSKAFRFGGIIIYTISSIYTIYRLHHSWLWVDYKLKIKNTKHKRKSSEGLKTTHSMTTHTHIITHTHILHHQSGSHLDLWMSIIPEGSHTF